MDYFSTPKNQKNDELEVTGISRSGRVRKKSSKLVDFESPDDVTDHKLKKQKAQHEAQLLQAQQKLKRYEQQLQLQQQQQQQQQQQKPTPPPPPQRQPKLTPLTPLPSQRQPKQNLQNTNSVQLNNSVKQTNFVQQRKSYGQPTVHFKEPIKMKQEVKPESSSEDEEDEEDSSSEDSESEEDANGLDDSIESMSDDAMDSMAVDEEEDEESEPECIGFTKLEPPEQQTDLPSKAKSSLYMLEKYKKKIIIKDGKVINNNKSSKSQRKDKGKTRYTAYMLWARETRQQLLENDPNLDFSTISKKLGELWATVPNLEKCHWRKRAQRCALNPQTADKFGKISVPTSRNFINKIGNRNGLPTSPPQKVIHLGTPRIGNKMPVTPPLNKVGKDGSDDPHSETSMYKIGTQPIDVAAHLTLLGESLTVIGQKLKEHEGQITVSGSLPLLLDSLICALGPLLCLTQQIPEMNGASPKTLTSTLENVSYIMPGL